jgi:drug/metabolite transporter (DMT)-like permease
LFYLVYADYYNIAFTIIDKYPMLSSMSWFYLALLAPFLYAIVNLLDDNLLSFVYKNPYLPTMSAGFYGTLPLLSLFFLHATAIPTHLALLAFGAGFLTLGVYFFYFVALGEDVPSVVVALFALGPATIPFLAHFIVHERLAALEVAGFLIVLFGSIGLAVTDIKKRTFSRALVPMLLAVVFVDITAITTKYVYQRVDFYSAYMFFSAGMGAGTLAFFFLRYQRHKQEIRRVAKVIKKVAVPFVAVEVIGLGAEFVRNLAVSRGPVSLVEVIDGAQPVFVLFLAVALYPLAPKYFREAEQGKFLAKAILMLVIVAGLAVIGIAARS